MTRSTFTTTLTWHDNRGGEVETDARVLYSHTRGTAPSFDDPGSPDEIEIITITAPDPSITIPASFYEQQELLDECAEDWAAEQVAAQEWRAQCRRDDLLMERF